MTTILQRTEAARLARLEALRLETRIRLANALQELFTGRRVVVFGSLTVPHRFRADSDIDLALDEEPADRSLFGLMGELEERLGRPVDVVLLPRCRFRAKIQKEGEVWTN